MSTSPASGRSRALLLQRRQRMRTWRAAKTRGSLSERDRDGGAMMKHGGKKNRRFLRRLKMRQAERRLIAAGREAMRRKVMADAKSKS